MRVKKLLSMVIVVELLLVLFASLPATCSPKATERIRGGVYSPGDDFDSVTTGGVASYGNTTFYTPNADQPLSDGVYDVQYYNHPLAFYPDAPAGYPYYYGSGKTESPFWRTPKHLAINTAGETEYMVIVETINGITKNAAGEIWSGANFTGSTNMTATSETIDSLPNVYLEQIPTPELKSVDYITGTLIINWTGLKEYISDNCLDTVQSWKIQTSNILNYSVYRSDNGGEFRRVGNSTPQVRGGEVYFEDTVEPGGYRYRIAVNYNYSVNDGTNVIDQNGVNPDNTNGLPAIFVSTGRSNISATITMPPKPIITLNVPNGDEDWTGNSTHDINYTISSGTPPYTIYFNYTADGDEHPIGNESRAAPGTYAYPWKLPKNNSKNVEVKVTVVDSNSLSDMDISDNVFEIDSTAPGVVSTRPGDGTTDVGLTDLVRVVFNEPMDRASVEYAFSITPDPGGWDWVWNTESTIMTSSHKAFSANRTYNCTINTTAKDDSEPGNNMIKDYSWSFTVVPGISINIISPLGGEKWTGNITHNIIYIVAGGAPPYTICINYTIDGETFIPLYNGTGIDQGRHTYVWEAFPEIDSESVKVKVVATDTLNATDSAISNPFTIDSTQPAILIDSIIPVADMMAVLTQPVIIQFTEPMNTTSAEAAFSISPDLDEWNWKWNYNKDKMTGYHSPFVEDTIYTCTINPTAKDLSDPGNSLSASYSWSFKAVPGMGDLTVVVDYPASLEIGKDYTITVKIYNNGPKADNVSGSLTVTFYIDGKVFDTKLVPPIQENKYEEISSKSFSFDHKGTWNIKVRVSSSNLLDIIEGNPEPYEEVRVINVIQPIGIGPYLLIITMVILVLIIGALTIWSIKKKERKPF